MARPTICAALIVRDEQRFLPGCLESLCDRVDDIVIVDTGSTDDTMEIARRAGARLLHHEWAQDFAAARNVALDAVASDWVLYIDADERLGLPLGGFLGEYVDPQAIAGFVRFRPKTGYTRYREWRLFRNDPRLRFEGKIHETVVPAIRRVSAEEGWPIVQTAVEIDHLGYDGDLYHKHRRNLPLLQAAVKGEPDRAYYWYHLAETLAALGRREEACEAAQQGLASARRKLSQEQTASASMIVQLQARLAMEGEGNALDFIAEGLGRMADDYALWFLRGKALLDAGESTDALDIACRLLAIDPDSLGEGLLAFDRRLFGDQACELAALACLQLGRRQEAGEYFARAAQLMPDNVAYRLKAIAFGGARPTTS